MQLSDAYCICGNELPPFPIKCICEADLCIECAIEKDGLCILCSDFVRQDQSNKLDKIQIVRVYKPSRVCVDCDVTLPEGKDTLFKCEGCRADLCDMHESGICKKCRFNCMYCTKIVPIINVLKCCVCKFGVCKKCFPNTLMRDVSTVDHPNTYACVSHVRKCPRRHWMIDVNPCSFQACMQSSCTIEGCGKFNGNLYCPLHTPKCLCGNRTPASSPQLSIQVEGYSRLRTYLCEVCLVLYSETIFNLLTYRKSYNGAFPKQIISIILWHLVKLNNTIPYWKI